MGLQIGSGDQTRASHFVEEKKKKGGGGDEDGSRACVGFWCWGWSKGGCGCAVVAAVGS